MIDKFGADGVRMGVLISSPAGNDLPFDTSQCEQGRNFSNKIWNAYRLVDSWETKELPQPEASQKAIAWFQSKFNETLIQINDLFDKFKISEALMAMYKLVWDDFCSWYLEIIKPGYQHPIDQATLDQTKIFFEDLLKLIQPYTPFIAEELWHLIRERADGEDIIVASWPEVKETNEKILKSFESAVDIITNIRNIRKKNSIANKVKMELFVKANGDIDKSMDSVISKMGNLSQLEYVNEKVSQANGFISSGHEFYIPFGDAIDVDAEKAKLTEELNYTKGFLKSVHKKLQNEKFMAGAPEQVVAVEKKKEADALGKIAILEEKLAELN